jgi:hypothetical protein
MCEQTLTSAKTALEEVANSWLSTEQENQVPPCHSDRALGGTWHCSSLV